LKGVTDLVLPTGIALPVLVDAEGKNLALAEILNAGTSINSGEITQEIYMVFSAGPGVGAPDRLILFGHRLVTAQVPFRFESVPLR
jgi:hypothetical protein